MNSTIMHGSTDIKDAKQFLNIVEQGSWCM